MRLHQRDDEAGFWLRTILRLSSNATPFMTAPRCEARPPLAGADVSAKVRDAKAIFTRAKAGMFRDERRHEPEDAAMTASVTGWLRSAIRLVSVER
jgi:hypothetical protein